MKILRGVPPEKLNRMAPYLYRISRKYLTSRFHLQNSIIELSLDIFNEDSPHNHWRWTERQSDPEGQYCEQSTVRRAER